MAIEIEVSIWLASKTRWVQIVKTMSLPVMPRVGEYRHEYLRHHVGPYHAAEYNGVNDPTEEAMKTHVLRGSKQEIADRLVHLQGDVREAIVFEDEPPAAASGVGGDVDIFAEMQPYMVAVDSIDDSRDAIYSRMDGE